MKLQHGSQHAYQLTWCQILLIHYTRATEMADRGPNPDLWMATAGPHQPLKGVFYTQKFLSQNFALLVVLLKHLLLANCVIVS